MFILALILCGAIAVGHVPRKVTTHEDGVVESVANITSQVSNDSNTVEVSGIRFEIQMPERVLTVPKKQPDTYTPVYVVLSITNSTLIPFRFSRFFIPQLVGLNRQFLERGGGGDATFSLRESDCPIVMPGRSVTFFLNGRLLWRNNTLQIELDDRAGSVISFYDLKPVRYQLRLAYSKKSETAQVYDLGGSIFGRTLEGFWTGKAITRFVKVYIVHS